jgi:hypothetical protein
VGGQGKAAPDFAFGTMYRLRSWRDGAFAGPAAVPAFLAASADPAQFL